MANYGDWQFATYLAGLQGVRPELPMSWAELERRAEQALSPELWSYVAGGAGDERTQRVNVEAFDRWGLMPRMLVGAAQRDLSVQLFGRRLPTPLLMAPVGVIALCDPDGHGDLATARAAAATGVPMVASTLMQDPLEEVAAALGDTPGYFQLYPPDDRELTESFVHRAEAAGYAGIVVTLDTLTLGWRPRDLALASFPQLRGLCLANYFTDPVFRAKLAVPPEEDQQAATGLWASLFGTPALTWADLDWLRSLTRLPLLLKGICAPRGRPPGRRRRAWTGSTAPTTAAGRPTVGCRRWTACPAWSRRPATSRSGSTPGVRGGAHVVKALALGATAVGVGRPYAYGLAVGGQAGIEHVLRCLLAETDLIMAVDGYPRIADLTPDALRRVGR